MQRTFSRRSLSKMMTIGVTASQMSSLAGTGLNLKIGHTGLTWLPLGGKSLDFGSLTDPHYVEQTIRDISNLGFWGVEFFSNQIEAMEKVGGVGTTLKHYNLPLISAYCMSNLSDPAKRKESTENISRWAKLVKKYGGSVVVIGPNGVKRETYQFSEHKAQIVAALNDAGRAANDAGVTAVLHQHTGTCVESREETYEILNAMDSRLMKFGPDIGQLQKGGSDPVQVVKDFLPIVHHMHLKDYSGGEQYLGYCPLGQGKVNIPEILKMLDGKKIEGRIMVELDSPPPQPVSAVETAKIAKAYLRNLGVQFRA